MKQRGRTLARWAVALHFGILFGLLGTVVSMIRAFLVLGTSQPDTASQEALASNIAAALWTTAAGLLAAIVGAVFLVVALLGQKYRSPWFYKWSTGLAILWLLHIPLGTIFGIFLLIYLGRHKSEFLTEERSTEPAGGAYVAPEAGAPSAHP